MTLKFQMRREDVLALTREYCSASPVYRRTQTRARLTLPIIMLIIWIFKTSQSEFNWTSTVIFLGAGLLWFFLYPTRFNRDVEKYSEKSIDEGSQSKNFGPCELTLSDAGFHDVSPNSETKFQWSAIDRCYLTDTYLFIFLNGPMGYPIQVADIGIEDARKAMEYINSRR